MAAFKKNEIHEQKEYCPIQVGKFIFVTKTILYGLVNTNEIFPLGMFKSNFTIMCADLGMKIRTINHCNKNIALAKLFYYKWEYNTF